MQSPNQIHFGAVKRVLQRLGRTTDYGIWHWPSESVKLLGYINND